MNGDTLIQNKKLNTYIRITVAQALQEILTDPEYGLELTELVKKRLKSKPKKLIPFEQIKKKYC